MRKLTVRFKLYVLLTGFLLSLAGVGSLSWVAMQQAKHSMTHISQSLASVETLSSLHTARLAAIAAMQEGANWRPELFEDFPDKSYAISEAKGLFKDVLERHSESLKAAENAFTSYENMAKNADQQALWERFKTLWAEFKSTDADQLIIINDLLSADNWHQVHNQATALTGHTTKWVQVIQISDPELKELIQLSVANAEAIREQAFSGIDATRQVVTLAVAIASVVLGLLAMGLVKSITHPLNALKQQIEKVGELNDFTLRVEDAGKDEVALTAQSFNTLLERVQQALKDVIQNAGTITQAANQTSVMSQQVSTGAEKQTTAATDIASAVEQMSASVVQINESAQEALIRAERTAKAAHQGVANIELSGIESNKAIEQVTATSEAIQALGRESEQISSIISVITSIAEQINLLALNAAIEAARAGEHGRGFAVVADEVRSLASRTSTSAAEVREMVNAIQQSTRHAITDMSLVVTSTEQSRSLIASASESMNEILQCAGAVSEAIQSVSQAMREQQQSTELISERIENVASMSQENCTIGEEAATVSQKLDASAQHLHQSVRRFKV